MLSRLGRAIFALAIVGLGVETMVCAHMVGHAMGQQFDVVPVLPWVPAIPWVAYLSGGIWVLLGAGLVFPATLRKSALALGTVIFLCTVVLEVPRYAANVASMSYRTGLFEPLALATLAWLSPGAFTPPRLARAARYLLALSLIVFGVDHFLALAPIGRLLPEWIPWHVSWIAFFGAAFLAAAFSIALDRFRRPAAFCLGLMFAIWVVTLHLPRVLGLYGIAGAPRNPNEWSSLVIAVGFWGGLWALAF